MGSVEGWTVYPVMTDEAGNPDGRALVLGPGGRFEAYVPRTKSTWKVRRVPWLRKAISVDATVVDPSPVYFFLVSGDVAVDNKVSVADLSSVLIGFGKAYPRGDLDGDGLVTIYDISIVLKNYGTFGDP